MSTKHTPGPLGFEKFADETQNPSKLWRVFSVSDRKTLIVTQLSKPDVTRLVHCWNCHDELLAELYRLHDLPIDDEGNRVIPPGFMDSTRAAIAKATNPS